MKTKQAVNPYLPSWGIRAGCGAAYCGRTMYTYMVLMIFFNGLNFCLGDYVCWSAPVDDLGNWRYEGVIFKESRIRQRRRSVLQMVWQHRI